MKINRFAVSLGVVAVAAFLAGRADFSFNSNAIAQDHKHDHDNGHAHDQGAGMSDQMTEMFAKMEEAGQPGKHHKVLDRLVGTWEGTYTVTMMPGMPPMEMEGRAEREWILGGRYLKETVTSSFQGEEFHGLGFLGYNNTTGEYEMIWMDSHSTGIYKESGSYDPTTQTLMTFSHMANPMTGKMSHSSSRVDLSNSNRQRITGMGTGPNGEWYTMFGGDFRRVSE